MQLNTTAPTMAVPLDWKPGFRQLGSGAQLKPLWARGLHPLPQASRGFTNDLAGNHRLLRRLVATAFRCASSFTPHACWYSLRRNSFSFSFSYHIMLSSCWCSCAGRSRQINSPGCDSVPFLSFIPRTLANHSQQRAHMHVMALHALCSDIVTIEPRSAKLTETSLLPEMPGGIPFLSIRPSITPLAHGGKSMLDPAPRVV
jgi:hypothetical protein